MNSIIQWLKQLQFDGIVDMLMILAASLLCIMCHEVAHGVAACWMGDDTAKRAGRLSFNPLSHIDFAGLVMMALFRFGWAKPVPIDMHRFRSPRLGMAMTALAGPFSNILLVFVSSICRLITVFFYMQNGFHILQYVILFFEYIMVLSAGLAVFNLIPIPPLDGSKILLAILPERVYVKVMRYERIGMIILVLMLVFNVLDVPLMTMRNWVLEFSEFAISPIALLLQNYL